MLFNRLKYLQKYFKIELLFFKDAGGTYLFDKLNVSLLITSDIDLIIKKLNKSVNIVIIDTPEVLPYLKPPKQKIIYEFHSTYSNAINSYIEADKIVNAFIVPSLYMSKKIINNFKPQKEVLIVYNTLDFSNFNKMEVYPKSNIPVLLWIGRFDEHKNWTLLKKILSQCKAIDYKFKAILIGGKYQNKNIVEHVQSEVEHLKKNYDIEWYPFVEHEKMPYFYSLASNSRGGLISTSIDESFGMIFLEAISCECKVFANNINVVDEFELYTPSIMNVNMNDQNIHEIVIQMINFFENDNLGVGFNKEKFDINTNGELYKNYLHKYFDF